MLEELEKQEAGFDPDFTTQTEMKTNTEKWIAAGCTIYTVDNWQDGTNHGAKRIGATFDPDYDSFPTDEQADLCGQIVREHNSHAGLLAALTRLLEPAPETPPGERNPELEARIKQARAALAAAQGKE